MCFAFRNTGVRLKVKASPRVEEYWKSSFPRRPMNEWHRSFLAVLNCSLNHSCIALDDDDDNGSTTLCVRVKRDDNGTAGFGDTIHTVADNCPWNVEAFAGGVR